MIRTMTDVSRYQLTLSAAVSGLGVRRGVSSLFHGRRSQEAAVVAETEGEVSELEWCGLVKMMRMQMKAILEATVVRKM
jgi:hypothetical protein